MQASTASAAAVSSGAARRIAASASALATTPGDLVPSSEQPPMFPKLFTPITLGARRPVMELPCRALMNPLYLGIEEDFRKKSNTDDLWKVMAEFYSLRTRGGCPLIISGGISPSWHGRWYPGALALTSKELVAKYRIVTDAVHEDGGRIMLQMLHGGTAACSPLMVAASGGWAAASPRRFYKWAAPIGVPRFALRYIITEYMRTAELAKQAGFDGVEIPCCYGTFLHNFLVPATNHRTDEFGFRTVEDRARALLQTVDAVRQAVPDEDFLLSVRLSINDLLPEGEGCTKMDIEYVAGELQDSGHVDLLCCVAGMNESPVQANSSYVPRHFYDPAIKNLRDFLLKRNDETVCAVAEQYRAEEKSKKGTGEHMKSEDEILLAAEQAARINMPVVACAGRYPRAHDAEAVLVADTSDMVGLGRPLLVDCNYLLNARDNVPLMTMPCIGCNRCLDLHLKAKRVSCAINPISGYELEWLPLRPVVHKKIIAVVGAGAAGMTCALVAARRGHIVHLYEQAPEIGGQLNMAKVVPGKEDYWLLLEHWTHVLKQGVPNLFLHVGTEFTKEEVSMGDQHFDAVVFATGSLPKPISSHTGGMNVEHASVVQWTDVLARRVSVGRRVAVIGNGAIGYDVCSYLVHDAKMQRDGDRWAELWGIDRENRRGIDMVAHARPPRVNNRVVTLFQKADHGPGLMRCKAWAQERMLRSYDVSIIDHALIGKVDDAGLHFSTPLPEQKAYCLAVDTVVFASGMIPSQSLSSAMLDWHYHNHVNDIMRSDDESMNRSTYDFATYLCGSARDVENMEQGGEADLRKVISEGFEVGNKV